MWTEDSDQLFILNRYYVNFFAESEQLQQFTGFTGENYDSQNYFKLDYFNLMSFWTRNGVVTTSILIENMKLAGVSLQLRAPGLPWHCYIVQVFFDFVSVPPKNKSMEYMDPYNTA